MFAQILNLLMSHISSPEMHAFCTCSQNPVLVYETKRMPTYDVWLPFATHVLNYGVED